MRKWKAERSLQDEPCRDVEGIGFILVLLRHELCRSLEMHIFHGDWNCEKLVSSIGLGALVTQ
jgi:hypothetical protein